MLTKCLFHSVTGLYCPGCGGTRAVHALLKGQLLLSAAYHPIPLYLLAGAVVLVILFTRERRAGSNRFMRYLCGYIIGAAAITLLNFIIRDSCLLLFGLDLMPGAFTIN